MASLSSLYTCFLHRLMHQYLTGCLPALRSLPTQEPCTPLFWIPKHSHSLFMREDDIYSTLQEAMCLASYARYKCPKSLHARNVRYWYPIDGVCNFEAMKYSSYIIYTNGSVSSCGNNDLSQPGDGTNLNQLMPEVQLDGAVARLLGVGSSAESVLFVINDDERVLRTGLNDRGQPRGLCVIYS